MYDGFWAIITEVKEILSGLGIQSHKIEICAELAGAQGPITEYVRITFKTKADMHLYKVTDNKQYYTYKGRPTNIRCEME